MGYELDLNTNLIGFYITWCLVLMSNVLSSIQQSEKPKLDSPSPQDVHHEVWNIIENNLCWYFKDPLIFLPSQPTAQFPMYEEIDQSNKQEHNVSGSLVVQLLCYIVHVS